ncbi:hypothetical protein [Corynebacterium sp. ES2715-CONJ3]|uniref:hypothetical protein n=1 Tax=Corynebacterium sp. ES2715-CONJ3 TaxID=2974028 RepID=UPI002169E966|nr:hypothetical protein [Corynebacterium sp. ES2715-CONJ3]MCS4492588.1 hypothetical protein [Corynebacterium sp. ES2715-CONJ3]
MSNQRERWDALIYPETGVLRNLHNRGSTFTPSTRDPQNGNPNVVPSKKKANLTPKE